MTQKIQEMLTNLPDAGFYFSSNHIYVKSDSGLLKCHLVVSGPKKLLVHDNKIIDFASIKSCDLKALDNAIEAIILEHLEAA